LWPLVSLRLPDLVVDHEFVVRLWRPEDVPALHRAVIDNLEHLRPWMPWISLEPLTEARRLELVAQWRAGWERGETAPMAMLSDGGVVGGTGYSRRPGSTALEIGYWVHAAHLGRGFATRAARLLTSAAFAGTEVPAVEIHHDKANTRSGLVPARLGFRFVGEQPDPVAAPGETGVDWAWRMAREEWPDALARSAGGDRP
jgi:ribosomal-protein-serine acetyltransferase